MTKLKLLLPLLLLTLASNTRAQQTTNPPPNLPVSGVSGSTNAPPALPASIAPSPSGFSAMYLLTLTYSNGIPSWFVGPVAWTNTANGAWWQFDTNGNLYFSGTASGNGAGLTNMSSLPTNYNGVLAFSNVNSVIYGKLAGDGSRLTGIAGSNVSGMLPMGTNSGQGTLTYSGPPIYWTPGVYGDLSTAYGAFKFPQVGGTNYPNIDTAAPYATPTMPLFVPPGIWTATNQITWPISIVGSGPESTTIVSYFTNFSAGATDQRPFVWITNNVTLKGFLMSCGWDGNPTAAGSQSLIGGFGSTARFCTNVLLENIWMVHSNSQPLGWIASAGSTLKIRNCRFQGFGPAQSVAFTTLSGSGDLFIDDCEFTNTAAYSVNVGDVNLTLQNSRFSGTFTNVFGSAGTVYPNWQISGCTFTNAAYPTNTYFNHSGAGTRGSLSVNGCVADPGGIRFNSAKLQSFAVQFVDRAGSNYLANSTSAGTITTNW